jgi:hypothetical protein
MTQMVRRFTQIKSELICANLRFNLRHLRLLLRPVLSLAMGNRMLVAAL